MQKAHDRFKRIEDALDLLGDLLPSMGHEQAHSALLTQRNRRLATLRAHQRRYAIQYRRFQNATRDFHRILADDEAAYMRIARLKFATEILSTENLRSMRTQDM